MDERDDTVGKRIRNAEVEKIPYVIVYGDKESDESLAVREHGGGKETSKSFVSLAFRGATRESLAPYDFGLEGSFAPTDFT